MTDGFMPFEFGPKRYQPDPGFCYAEPRDYVLDQQVLARLVGTVALGLPFVMLLGAAVATCFYDSISHFYYARFLGDVLVAALAFIGTFLIAYRGESRRENRLATLAGLAAFGIALFPTAGDGCDERRFSGRILADLEAESLTAPLRVEPAVDPGRFFELFAQAQTIHFASAAALFAFLAFYTFVVFTRVIEEEHLTAEGTLTPEKAARNRFYVGCGLVIVVSIAALGAYAVMGWSWWNDYNLTFWFEALALWAFGLSWMVKGRFYGFFLLDPRDRAVRGDLAEAS